VSLSVYVIIKLGQKQERKENEELLAGQAITKKQKGSRQTKLTSAISAQKASTLPSAYGEVIQPIVPEFQEKAIKKAKAPKKSSEEKEKGEVLSYHTDALMFMFYYQVLSQKLGLKEKSVRKKMKPAAVHQRKLRKIAK